MSQYVACVGVSCDNVRGKVVRERGSLQCSLPEALGDADNEMCILQVDGLSPLQSFQVSFLSCLLLDAGCIRQLQLPHANALD